MTKLFLFPFFVFVLLVLLPLPSSQYLCAAYGKEIVLAEVNGDTIDEDALQERLKAIHRNKPKIRPEGGAVGIKISDLVQEMIDERLVIQDAYRLELDRDPDFKKKVESYVTSRSVIRLRQEEVIEKINITDDECLAYFRKHYEKECPAPEGRFEKLKRRITKNLRKEKEKELSDNFVAGLRAQADVRIDKELFDLLDPESDYEGKKTVIARVNGHPIPLDDMLHDMRQTSQKRTRMFAILKNDPELEKMRKELKQDVLDTLITYELVEQEALKRNYVNDPAFAKTIQERKDRLLIDEFKAKIVYPLSIPSEKDLRQYYEEHVDDFKKGYEVWFREMTFYNREDADKTLKELRQGAGFEYLAARVSVRWMPRRRDVWVNADRFSPVMREALNRLKVGEISDVIADGKEYKIIKLKGKRGGEPIEFSRVVEHLKRAVGQNKFGELLSDYLARLRQDSKIKINKKALKRIQKEYWNSSPKEAQTTAG